MSDDLVQLSNATRRYIVGSNIVFALKEVSCAVKSTDHIAVMGASGSGKTTLLAMMAALDEPDSGTVSWPSVLNKASLRPKHISVSFQSASLLPSLTIKQNVEVPLLVLGERNSSDLADEALDRLGLLNLSERFPDEISGGQAQRVALARAMAVSPKLLLADEPTGQLDQETGQSVLDTLIAWANATHCTLVVATHDQQVARKFKSLWRMNFGALSIGT
ncbi:MAG: ATP-binding cassette domain-containing protein [Pseudomonadota bacterium]|nr:ATP-binding cassette domain-containing protein [Pseudomonadota bacterium]